MVGKVGIPFTLMNLEIPEPYHQYSNEGDHDDDGKFHPFFKDEKLFFIKGMYLVKYTAHDYLLKVISESVFVPRFDKNL